MNTVVILKMVPDVVEELEIDADGTGLDPDAVRLIPSESDEHALEEALLIKEREGGQVTVAALDAAEVDDALFTALAKGADRAVKIDGPVTQVDLGGSSSAIAAWLGGLTPPPDLVLTGTQAVDDLWGLAGTSLAHCLGRPYVGIVTAVSHPEPGRVTATKEFPAGVRGEVDVPLPAVLGIQAAEKPPRYVPVAKVRAAMKTQRIDEVESGMTPAPPLAEILRMAKPEAAGHAEMIEGRVDEQVARLVEILETRGLV